jgi:hypothetical protein
MKKLIVALSLLFSAPSWAEWTLIAGQDGDKTYIDLPTIRKDGNLRKAWSLISFIKPNKEGVMSKRIRFEFDCKNETYQVLSASYLSKEMALGEVLFNSDLIGPKSSIPPDTLMSEVFDTACSKK